MRHRQSPFSRNRLSLLISQVLSTGTIAGLASGMAIAATLTVTTNDDNTTDDLDCTLREAVETINGSPPNDNCGLASGTGDTVDLGGLSGIITLTNGQIRITSDIYIDGPGKEVLSISGNKQSRILYIYDTSEVTIEGVTLTAGNASEGGAIFNSNGDTALINSTVSGSSASDNGGGIYNQNGNTTLIDSTVSGNSAYEDGGGIYNKNGNTTLIDSTVSDNSARLYGGGIYTQHGNTALIKSTVSGNSVDYYGGGVFNYSGNTLLVNSTVSGNSAYYDGGGLHNKNGNTTLIHSTVSANTTNDDGGGIYNQNGDTTLLSSLISGNTAPMGAEVYNKNGTVSADANNLFGHAAQSSNDAFYNFTPSGSDINATSDGTNTPLASILDTSLTDHGGPTETHALIENSPAIDAAPNCSDSPVNREDQRGFPRDEQCDTGAVEFGDFVELLVEKSVDGSFSSGELINYTIEIINISAATQLDNPGPEFVDMIPDTLLLTNAYADSGNITLDKLNNTVTWDGSIEPEQTITIVINTQLSATAQAGDEIENQAVVFYSRTGGLENNDEQLSSDPDAEEAESPTVFIVATVVPTLSYWAMGLLSGFLVLGAALRRRKT